MSNFIKDSANNYTLYVNQGTDFEIILTLSDFGITNVEDIEFFGIIKKHRESKKSYDVTLTLLPTPNRLSVKIPADVSIDLKDDRYSIDILYKSLTLTNILLSGTVIVKQTLTRI